MNAAARAAAVVPAAGRGERLGGDTAKPFVMLCGRPLLQYALTALEQVAQIETVAVVVAVDAVPRAREIVRRTRLRNVAVVTGGPDRQASVKRGLDALPPGPDLVLVHDGARPLLSPALASAVLSAAERDGAATASLPVSETVKRGEDGWV
ncbi:MAG TPA: 2-C-methyl-D-erythritol 4-phosphate cytidylyltransferase, partial [bacterium]|nr:2-C-methyl-D-erythritol 4-phosphate cytidylyltransferase [bacterium]